MQVLQQYNYHALLLTLYDIEEGKVTMEKSHRRISSFENMVEQELVTLKLLRLIYVKVPVSHERGKVLETPTSAVAARKQV